jgi:hypothetical protein
MVEFALVVGLFLFLVFAMLNGGLFLYASNSVAFAADVGVAKIAAEGDVPSSPPSNVTLAAPGNVDQVAVAWMDSVGLNRIPLVTVTEIDVWKEVQQANGSLRDSTTGCSGGPCEDRYALNGTILNTGGVVPWQPSSRSVSQAAGPDFARLVISYRYQLLASAQEFSVTTSNTFRLEPLV